MKLNVFDTRVRTGDGRYLHFDVLTEGDDQARAGRIAQDWLADRGISAAQVTQSQCLFCHSETATPAMVEAIGRQGYFIIPLQGC